MKPIVMTEAQWGLVLEQIKKTHPRSVWMIRDKMRRVLGFTPREHVDYDQKDWRLRTTIHLDFFDEQQRTMFLLKYGDYLR